MPERVNGYAGEDRFRAGSIHEEDKERGLAAGPAPAKPSSGGRFAWFPEIRGAVEMAEPLSRSALSELTPGPSIAAGCGHPGWGFGGCPVGALPGDTPDQPIQGCGVCVVSPEAHIDRDALTKQQGQIGKRRRALQLKKQSKTSGSVEPG